VCQPKLNEYDDDDDDDGVNRLTGTLLLLALLCPVRQGNGVWQIPPRHGPCTRGSSSLGARCRLGQDATDSGELSSS